MSPWLGGGDQDQQLVPEDPEGAQPQPGHGGGGGQQEPVTEQPRYVQSDIDLLKDRTFYLEHLLLSSVPLVLSLIQFFTAVILANVDAAL